MYVVTSWRQKVWKVSRDVKKVWKVHHDITNWKVHHDFRRNVSHGLKWYWMDTENEIIPISYSYLLSIGYWNQYPILRNLTPGHHDVRKYDTTSKRMLWHQKERHDVMSKSMLWRKNYAIKSKYVMTSNFFHNVWKVCYDGSWRQKVWKLHYDIKCVYDISTSSQSNTSLHKKICHNVKTI